MSGDGKIIVETLSWTNTSYYHIFLFRQMAANQNHYLQAYPSLNPLASGRETFTAAAVNAGALLDHGDITDADLQYGHRKAFRRADLATVDEVFDAKRRKTSLETEHNFAGIAPVWAQQLQQGLQQQMQGLQQGMTHYLDYMDAKNYNRSFLQVDTNIIGPVPHKTTGGLPTANGVWYPESIASLDQCRNVDATALLTFYGLDNAGTCPAKRLRIKMYLGIRH
jgi:hypothetical protein